MESRFEEARSPSRTPTSILRNKTPSVPTHEDTGPGYFFGSPSFQSPVQFRTSGSPNWWSPFKEGQSFSPVGGREPNKSSSIPISGVCQKAQQSGGLLTLPTVREIVRPDSNLNASLLEASDHGDEWVTVFGFGVSETNIVMRELKKCGTIERHVPGPGGANWIHVQFQNKHDAKKALYRNGMQVNGVLMMGVKPIDPLQREAVMEKSHRVFNVISPRTPGKGTLVQSGTASSRLYYLQPSEGGSHAAGPIASPSKSTFSKIVDLVFGM